MNKHIGIGFWSKAEKSVPLAGNIVTFWHSIWAYIGNLYSRPGVIYLFGGRHGSTDASGSSQWIPIVFGAVKSGSSHPYEKLIPGTYVCHPYEKLIPRYVCARVACASRRCRENREARTAPHLRRTNQTNQPYRLRVS